MNRILMASLTLLVTFAAFAQEAPRPAAAEGDKIVAVINGETITRARLDTMYGNMSAQMRSQYEKSGGKQAFLENYIGKRLLIQEALKSGFEKRADVKIAMEAAAESALFDRYIREVISGSSVSEGEVRKFFEDNQGNFARPERVKVRHIVIGFNKHSKEEAMGIIGRIAGELHASAIPNEKGLPTPRVLVSRFSDAARRYSQDGVAEQGGDLGWVERGVLDPSFEEAAFNMAKGNMSGIVESKFGYHLILLEDKEPAGTQPYEAVRADIREYLLGQKMSEIMSEVKRLTNELRTHSKVSVYSENMN